MFNFLHYRKREEVQRVLAHRVNHACLGRMREGARHSARIALDEIVFVVPIGQRGQPDFAQAAPAIGKDISVQGLALVHTAPVDSEEIVVALQDVAAPRFVRCRVQHCTRLGYGFFHVGLFPVEIVKVDEDEVRRMHERLAQFDKEPEVAAPVK